MDTSLYRYVIAATEAGSFSAAARDLYISQPALTKQIGKLEAQLGQKLFVRTRNSFEITASGALFVDYARKIVALEDKLMQTLTIPDSSAEVIHIATSHRGGTYAARHSSMFYQNYSNVVIDMCNLSALGCEQSLEEERTELAIFTTPVISDHLDYVQLSEDLLYLVVPTRFGIFTPEELAASRAKQPIFLAPERILEGNFLWLTAPKGQGLYHAEQKLFTEISYTPPRTRCVEHVDTRYSLAAVGNGIALMPGVTIHKEDMENGQIAACALNSATMTRGIVVARKKGIKLSKYAEIYWNYLISNNQRSRKKQEGEHL